MIRLTELRLPLNHPEDALRAAVLARLGIADRALRAMEVFRRGYDARKPQAIMLVYTLDCDIADEAEVLSRHAGDQRIMRAPDTAYRFVARAPGGMRRPVVVGTGPCGFMAALLLAQMGFRPLILERGKAVRERTKDTWGLWRRGVLDPESNVQYGEGGAGTFSDGKLYSQIRDPRHYGRKVLAEFVKAGAPEEILYVSKPHIGTFRLVSMVEHIRAEIEALGGEYRFGARVDDLIIETEADGTRRLRGLVLADGEVIEADHAILALGH
ncbi:MAG: NAD(P)/FAD-dependent oxidoreductase, partial [Alphaproteobacteria bacterium]